LHAFPKLANASLTLIQGIRVCIEAKIKIFIIISLNQGQGRIFKRECTQSIFRIKLPPKRSFSGRKFKNFRFSLQYTHSDSLNQGQRSVFKLRECVQLISRIKLALIESFLKKNFGSKKHEKSHKFRCFNYTLYF
jgi:hypothetical protein